MSIISIQHPSYSSRATQWLKWRYAYEGGDEFLRLYMRKYSKGEDNKDFAERKLFSPIPAFAKAAINDIKNSFAHRMSDVARRGGPQSYQDAILGKNNGVDLHGKSMTQYIDTEIISELLVMACVGIYVDAPPIAGRTARDQIDFSPYLYTYRVEQIKSWAYRQDKPDEFQALLLEDCLDQCHPETGLPMGEWIRYRHIFISPDDGKVHVQFYNQKGERCNCDGDTTYGQTEGETVLDLDTIPFVTGELTESLMKDVANHQISLLNMESSDVAFVLKANIPIYTEQVSGMEMMGYNQGPADPEDGGTAAEASSAKDKSIKVGNMQGRRYAQGMDRPEFIHPSSETMKASMDKQQQLKNDIRLLVNLALSNVQPKMASAESKDYDERGLEAGLASVGLVLEHVENKIAKYWAMYTKATPGEVSYPKSYSLQSDEDRRKQVDELQKIRDSVPSGIFSKEVSKQMARTLLGCVVDTNTLDKIMKEIDESDSHTFDPKDVIAMVEAGVCSGDLAEQLLGLPKGTFDKAQKEKSDRAALIAASQGPALNPAARGVPDLSADPKAEASQEKQQAVQAGGNQRGEAAYV